MQVVLLASVVHVSAAVFWAGSTFAALRRDISPSLLKALFVPQLGASWWAIVSGGFLYWRMYAGASPSMNILLLHTGAAAGILAAFCNAIVVGLSLRRAGGSPQEVPAAARAGQRITAVLLGVAVLAMSAFRFA